jgi:hypothetical protein
MLGSLLLLLTFTTSLAARNYHFGDRFVIASSGLILRTAARTDGPAITTIPFGGVGMVFLLLLRGAGAGAGWG